MKFSMKYIILYVNDFDKAMKFYNNVLKLPIKMQQDTYVEFDTGNTILAINTRKSVIEITGLNIPVSAFTTQTFEVGFVVENVQSTINELKQQGVIIIKEPIIKPWGQTVAYIADPDGHFIEICSEI
ncbi:VOC family protein [Solibacillus sp. MA9]|uniref:VOC family protein n=1 Tax=Solibacillus palustris TaxID=2908203 RepID=A0ABS9UIA3_9BACL|nr:VOC family protein [Solibacillus sp. MA9]MCH7324067.1 VOC family protein [Solibacillus sp. MA9]